MKFFLLEMLIFLLKFLILVIPVLVSVAFLTLMERKLLSLTGLRQGPNKVSVGGFLQPIGDAVKLSNKSINSVSNFCWIIYYFSSFSMILMSLSLFSSVICFPSPLHVKFSFMLLLLVLGLNSLNSVLSGWSTYSKFSLLGSIRTVSQLISYEGALYLCFFFLCLVLCSFDLSTLMFFDPNILGFLFVPTLYIWFPSFLAELNRTPYDFSEGESELVSGFNTEFGSSSFTLIFLAEYGSIFFFCLLGGFLFFSGYFIFFCILIFMVIWFRSVLPRFRFDKLMYLSWKFFIPFLTFFYLICFFFII